MRYHALAVDYDGTIAHNGRIEEPTAAALAKVRDSGRRLVLVTGRELDQILTICPQIELFHSVVAENGGLLYCPKTRESQPLANPPPAAFVDAIRAKGVANVSVGKVIVATWEPHQQAVLDVIQAMGLELQVIFNKGAVMVLPSGVNKATGLAAALTQLGLSPHNVVGVGDAENDHAFLSACEYAVAVQNAVPALKERADWTTDKPRGEGVVQVIDALLADDLKERSHGVQRHRLELGLVEADNELVSIGQYGHNILVCGTSGGGKSTLTIGLLERIHRAGYQFAIIDPEGDYDSFEPSAALGTAGNAPTVEEVIQVLRAPAENASVNLLGIAVEHRPEFFGELLPQLIEMRGRTGRPHWLIVDEAHHLLPREWKPTEHTLPGKMHNVIYITVHPESVALPVMQTIDVLIVIGEDPAERVARFCKCIGERCPKVPRIDKLERGDAIVWRRGERRASLVRTSPPRSEQKRHSRKYAEGHLGSDRSFFFKGREGKMNLKAHNLHIFLQMADGVDDDTWEFHRANGDYSRWMGEAGVKDKELAARVKAIEQDPSLSPRDSRAAIRDAVEAKYTLPADRASGAIGEDPTNAKKSA